MTKTINVLDHGFVKLRNLAGPTRRPDQAFDASDIDPAQAARMSFDQMDSERTYEQDMSLSNYLMRNSHSSPFEMVQVWLEVKVPIFVDRQLVRHRTWRRNEASGRYIVLPEEYYIPKTVGGKPTNGAKQGQSDTLDPDTQEWFKSRLSQACMSDYALYRDSMMMGVAPEHARMFLHLNHYVHWLGNVDLGNMFHFLRLRTHEHAQIEARAYAWAIVDLLREPLPGLMSLFDKYCR